jgi:hypothetical protein
LHSIVFWLDDLIVCLGWQITDGAGDSAPTGGVGGQTTATRDSGSGAGEGDTGREQQWVITTQP